MDRPANQPHRRPWIRRLAVAAAVAVGILVLGILVLLLLVDEDAIAARLQERNLPLLSQRIGREVRAGPVDVTLLPIPSAVLDGLEVEGSFERPLLAARTVRVRLDLWPLIRSLGKEVRFGKVELEGVEANLIRLADGSWGFDPILERLEAAEAAEPEGGGGTGRSFAVAELAVSDGTLRWIDRAAPGGIATAELRGIDATARNLGPGLPLELELHAALQSEEPNLSATLRIDPLPLELATLGPGDWPQVDGTLAIRGAPLGTLRNLLPGGLAEVATGGRLELDGSLRTEEGRYIASGTGGIEALRLRGEEARASFAFRGDLEPAGRTLQVALRDLRLGGPGIDLAGEARLASAPLRFSFALEGPLLDLDALLGALPEREEEETPTIPPAVRRRLHGARGEGTLAIAEVRSGRLRTTDLRARAILEGGTLTLSEAQTGFYGGTLRADGTTADLTRAKPTWRLLAKMEGVDLAEATRSVAGAAPLAGRVESELDLRGAGIDWEELRQALTGAGLLALQEGRLAHLDLDRALTTRLAEELQRLGRSADAARVEGDGPGTLLRELRARFVVRNGWMALRQPIVFPTSLGTVRLDGRIGLDWRLDLGGSVQVDPAWVARLTGGRLRPSRPVSLPIHIGGHLREPILQGLDTETVARALLPTQRIQRRAEAELDRRRREAERQARQRAREILEGVF